jgi:glucokinase
VADVVDPEVFVIGGGVSKAGQVLIDLIQKYYRQYVFHTSTDTEIVLAELGNDAGMYGSVRLVL